MNGDVRWHSPSSHPVSVEGYPVPTNQGVPKLDARKPVVPQKMIETTATSSNIHEAYAENSRVCNPRNHIRRGGVAPFAKLR